MNEDRQQRNERWREEMLELYHGLASNPKNPDTTRLSAATHLLNRLDGLPVAKADQPDEVTITIVGGLPERPR